MASDGMKKLCEVAHVIEADLLTGEDLPDEVKNHLYEALDKAQAVIAGTPALLSCEGAVVRHIAQKIDRFHTPGLEHSALVDMVSDFDAQVCDLLASAEGADGYAETRLRNPVRTSATVRVG